MDDKAQIRPMKLRDQGYPVWLWLLREFLRDLHLLARALRQRD